MAEIASSRLPSALPNAEESAAWPATPALQQQFGDLDQQHYADAFGMWVFLATEVLFFGGLFLSYSVYRSMYAEAFDAASNDLDVLLGTINTGVLLTSSLTMALAVHSAQRGKHRQLVGFLVATGIIGSGFLAIKISEWVMEYHKHHLPGPGFTFERDPMHAELFFWLYYGMTALHGLHVLIGVGVMTALTVLALRRRFCPEHHAAVEIGGLYWHFVDIIWIFLFPLLYLIDRHLAK